MDQSAGLILEARISWSRDKGLNGTLRSGQCTRRKQGPELAVYGLVLRAQVDVPNQPLWLQKAAYCSVPQFPHPSLGLLLPPEVPKRVTSQGLQMATRKEQLISTSEKR